MAKISPKWKPWADLYLRCARQDISSLRSDEVAAEEAYNYETHGGIEPVGNAFVHGKHLLDLTIKSWKEDLRTSYPPALTRWELLQDGWPDWLVSKL